MTHPQVVDGGEGLHNIWKGVVNTFNKQLISKYRMLQRNLMVLK
jgi:hypothetical protein